MRLTEEQEELRSAVRSLLTRYEGSTAWQPLAEQIGVAGLAVPEEYGGAGYGAQEVHVVMEELGRVLSPVPYLGSAVLTTQALLASGDEETCQRLLPPLAAGQMVGALAWAEQGTWGPDQIAAQAVPLSGGTWGISGTKEYVLDGADAELLLLAARTPAGLSLFEVAVDGVGLRREPTVTMDQTRALTRVVLDGVEGRLVGQDGEAGRVLRHVMDQACAALAAEQVGAAQRCLDLTVAYAKDRVQFGRAIGSFQAVKHRLADSYVLVEAARSAAMGAAFAAAEGSPELTRRAAVAKSACSEAFSTVAGEMVQLHGGIGITWEHDAHRYFKRAHSSSHLLGTPVWHRGRLSTELGLAAA
ncbi:acyl-CoA dehydrogenase family protein [Streptomyces sp. NPDC020845]|uniref:acyl-CoA dehydrogenase family protein n=1 Tax=Streptomyces sp. NPDC020845 TaxID=3365096 RepID=UPI0037A0258C